MFKPKHTNSAVWRMVDAQPDGEGSEDEMLLLQFIAGAGDVINLLELELDHLGLNPGFSP